MKNGLGTRLLYIVQSLIARTNWGHHTYDNHPENN